MTMPMAEPLDFQGFINRYINKMHVEVRVFTDSYGMARSFWPNPLDCAETTIGTLPANMVLRCRVHNKIKIYMALYHVYNLGDHENAYGIA